MQGIRDAVAFSDAKLAEVRSKLKVIVPDGQLIVTCGSYARREASAESDMDYYAILDDAGSILPGWSNDVKTAIKDSVGRLPSEQGAFATNIAEQELFENYGGSNDSNRTITRRMLYLLEGEYLTESDRFYDIRRRIIERYVHDTPADHQIAFYLLNDIIRYWRTLAVDYAHKTTSINPKPWAIRNIKLVFSRKLIYASGLFSVALTADRMEKEKIEILFKLFNMTPIERIKYICGPSASGRLMEMYNVFLCEMANPSTREKLTYLPREDRAKDPLFRHLKNEGHYFSRELMGLFHKTFHPSHPIHMAVIF